jgi:hypothetical protein
MTQAEAMEAFYEATGIGALKSTEAFSQFLAWWRRQQRRKKHK